MARILGLLPSALIAARGGMSANAWYQQLRAQGEAPRKSDAQRLFKEAKDIVTRSGSDLFHPSDQVPSGDDLGRWPTKTATGVAQTVSLVYRDPDTGVISHTWYRVTTPNGMTRAEAVAQAIDAYSGAAERYAQELLGAVHTSAYQLVPFAE